MAAKKHPVTQKVAEAAREYTPRSGNAKSSGEALWEYFLTLPDDEQGAFLNKMLHDQGWLEEVIDSISIIQSEGEPTRPLEEYIAEVERERAK